MSYERMSEAEKQLEGAVQALLEEAARGDAEENALHGKGTRDGELPEELKRRESRPAPSPMPMSQEGPRIGAVVLHSSRGFELLLALFENQRPRETRFVSRRE